MITTTGFVSTRLRDTQKSMRMRSCKEPQISNKHRKRQDVHDDASQRVWVRSLFIVMSGELDRVNLC